ncbi:hypothetical protein E8E15_000082, partial [Penicillium rubens]
PLPVQLLKQHTSLLLTSYNTQNGIPTPVWLARETIAICYSSTAPAELEQYRTLSPVQWYPVLR